MITINQIRDAVMKKLADKYTTASVVGEEIKRGFERPAFFVQIMAPDNDFVNPAHRERTLLVGVHYFVTGDKNHDLWAMQEGLDKLFSGVLAVDDRKLTIVKATANIADGVLQYWMTLDFTDSLDDVDVYGYEVPILGTTLNLKQDVEDN